MFATFYHRWNLLHALALTAGTVVLALARPTSPVVLRSAALALALWSAGAVFLLYRAGRRFLSDGSMGNGLSNLLTAARGTAAVGLFVLVALVPVIPTPGVWLLVAVLGLVEVTDFLDGYTARRAAARGQHSDFGPTWDMEHDALFTLAISVALLVYYNLPVFVLAIGLMRYAYVVVCRVDGDPVVLPRAYKVFAKTVAAAIVITGITTLAPIIPDWLRLGSLAVVLGLQSLSFGWDWILQRRSRPAVVASGSEA